VPVVPGVLLEQVQQDPAQAAGVVAAEGRVHRVQRQLPGDLARGVRGGPPGLPRRVDVRLAHRGPVDAELLVAVTHDVGPQVGREAAEADEPAGLHRSQVAHQPEQRQLGRRDAPGRQLLRRQAGALPLERLALEVEEGGQQRRLVAGEGHLRAGVERDHVSSRCQAVSTSCGQGQPQSSCQARLQPGG
jgi:hypothetical protein